MTARKGRPRGKATIAALVRDWVEVQGRFLESWERSEKYRVDQIIEEFGGMCACDLLRRDVEDWVARLRDDGCGPAKVNRLVHRLGAIYNSAIRRDVYEGKNPAEGIPKQREIPRQRYASAEECQALLKAADPWFANLLLVDVGTGLRPGELKALLQSDIDWTNHRLCVLQSKTKRHKTIPLVPIVEVALRRAIAIHGGASPLVFAQDASGYVPTDWRKRWASTVKRAGLVNLQMRDLRRTCGTWLAEHGVNASVIADILGHTGLAMLKHYSAISNSSAKRTALESLGLENLKLPETGV